MSKVLRITVSVSPADLEYLNRIGSNSPTQGIRSLVMLAREQTLPPKVQPVLADDFVVPAPPDNVDELLEGWSDPE